MATPIAVAQAKQDIAALRGGSQDEDLFDRLDSFVEAVEGRFPPAPDGVGTKIKRRDLNGKRLRIGDTVKVYDSARYGDPIATVLGEASGTGTKGPRVLVRLDDGRDDAYTPSQGRVERLVSTKTQAEAQAEAVLS